MHHFEPIAIVGQACVLPDALSPQALWENVRAGRSSLSPVPADRWRLSRDRALGSSADRTWSDRGGYVRGFEQVFDPSGFAIPAEEILALDPLFQWVLHGTREALRTAGAEGASDRIGLVLGNLSFPSAAMARYAESVWLGQGSRPHPRNRFMSGLPAHLAARALGLGAGAFALDAACASSLYAIKLACDRLHDHTADVMVAGAVNGADDLFIHVGFTALSALSRTGQSRPFHREADGLVPAEGAGFVVLKRLVDAIATGDEILGVIRGIGLSNDGRGRGLLVPSEEGQLRALEQAYQSAGLTPKDIGLVECHATGTPVGDATEIRSMSRLFSGCENVPIGSLKSNMGHLITAAGVAALLKVLGAMREGVRPPTLHSAQPIEALRSSQFRLLESAEPWNGPRRAGISAFGFGGNNAHLIVEAWDGHGRPAPVPAARAAKPVAIVGLGARVGNGEGAEDFAKSLFTGTPIKPRETFSVVLDGLKFPPRDLEQTLPQQLLMLEAAREAVEGLSLPRERTAVLIGMGCDPEIARYGARWRLPELLPNRDAAWLSQAKDAIHTPLEAAGVIGTMPNIPANRINSQLDLAAMGFTISSEELSGVVALEIAARALRAGEIDAAVVGAVDLSNAPVHQAALRELGQDRPAADAAVALVLKRLEDARRDGDRVLAVLDDETEPATRIEAKALAHAHAASGLLQVAAAATAVNHGATLDARPWLGERRAEVEVEALEGQRATVRLRSAGTAPLLLDAPPRLFVYSGTNRDEVLAALGGGKESSSGPARLVIVAADETEHATKAELARRWLREGGPAPEGIAFREHPLQGDLAFVFTGAAAGYQGMGRELVLALPELASALEHRTKKLSESTAWAYGPPGAPSHPLDQLWSTSFLCQIHAELTRHVLQLKPQAVIGYSSGETNALFAMGAWNDIDTMVEESSRGTIFHQDIAGDFAAVHAAWRKLGHNGGRWASYTLAAPIARVKEALQGERLAHLSIVNTPEECVIAGEANACVRVVERVGKDRAIPLGYDLAAHCPELEEIRPAWWALHRRETRDIPGVRFYSNGTGRSFHPTSESAADAITAQALHTLDFPKTIEQAYADGARVFVEHGPRGLCSAWIKRILGDREHLTIPLDIAGRSSVRQALNAVAWLVAAGVPVEASALVDRVAAAAPRAPRAGRWLTLPAHQPPVKLPPMEAEIQQMAPAPWLPPVMESGPAPSVIAPPPPAPQPKPAPMHSAPVQAVPAGVAAFQQQITALHQAFIAQQTAAHEQFLRVQQAATQRLLAGPVAMPAAQQPAPLPPPPVVAAPKPVQPAPKKAEKPGPKFDRAQLEVHASGRISTIYGPLFEPQDQYRRQVRMPEPPLLLADRVTGIDAEPGSMKTGTLWTETDVRADGWYLNPEGRMPAGIMIESGQADLMLISWLGVDLLNRGERVYRLLGCELTYHGHLPVPGETLCYDIHVDGHAKQGDIRLFFFHYDCQVNGQPRLTVRQGQAGFFTDQELAESGGVLWSPNDETLPADTRLDAPVATSTKRRFTPDELRAFSEGRAFDCFGPGFERAQTHVRSPRIAGERMLLLDEVVSFDPKGGPWGRGYLRAERAISPDDWFFKGHFKNDPCMPGTLMFEGCLQTMAIYLAGLGFTIERDGWRFEPVPEEKYLLRCRGQVIPSSKQLTYEVFVREVHAGPYPTLFADLLCTVNGLKAFHARRVGLRLVPDWPLEHWRGLGPHVEQETGAPVTLAKQAGLVGYVEPRPVAVLDGFRYDYASLLASAWGKPSDAFGQLFSVFDDTRRLARLPGPPYHFMSRVTRLDAAIGKMQAGGVIEIEYDVPEHVWYFAENGAPTMPFCVLLEAALQPCGWLACFVGSAHTSNVDLLFRNLDGTGTLLEEIRPGAGPLTTRVKIRTISQSAGMIIESFAVECFLGERKVYELTTVFGFFPKEAFENQVGLPATDAERARLQAPGQFLVDLKSRPARYCEGSLRLAGPMLLMLDRVTEFQPAGGKVGLGYLRAEKDVNPAEWFFKAHFFQDPVQPGSLGLEAFCQLLQFFMLERDLGAGLANARFEPLQLGRPLTWKYRGQVVPTNRRITTEMEITEIGEDTAGRYAVAEAWLWVDGKRIYHAQGLGMRIVSAP